MPIIAKAGYYRAKLRIGDKSIHRDFVFGDTDEEKLKAKKLAEYWLETRSFVADNKPSAIGVTNIDESISTVQGKHYLYLRLRKRREIVRSVSVGRLLDTSKESIQAKRQEPRYAETMALLGALKRENHSSAKKDTKKAT